MKLIGLVIVLAVCSCGASFAGQTLKEITTPPADTIEKKNVRIWIPVERSSQCYLRINIINRKSQVIRHLVDLMAGPGYYNFYWDKKDDSGAFVEAGTYTYVANNCGKKSYGEVKAEYNRAERKPNIKLKIMSFTNVLNTELFEDSVKLTIEWYDFRGRLVTTPVDTMLLAGEYQFVFANSNHGRDKNVVILSEVPSGRYQEIIKLNGHLSAGTKRRFEYKK